MSNESDKCNEILRMNGDNMVGCVTMTCGLDRDHKGLHCEQFHQRGEVIVLWKTSSSEVEE